MNVMYNKSTLILAACVLGTPLAVKAQTTVFSDNFGNGSTFNGTSTPGGTPTASSTSYDLSSSKTAVVSMTSGALNLGLSAGTTSGFWEAQAVFTGSPVTLQSVGDYIDLTYTFTDTANLLAGGSSSYVMTGLYGSGGNLPVAGTSGVSGNAVTLNTTAGSPNATGNAANWQGYVGRFAGSGGSSENYTRPLQNGSGTTSANQEVLLGSGTGSGSGTYVNPSGSQVGSTVASTLALTTGSQYTIDYLITLDTGGLLTLSDNLYSGAAVNPVDLLSSVSETTTSGQVSTNTTSFDSLAIGARNSGTSLNPQMQINQITVTESIQSVPEPATLALAGLGGSFMLFLSQRRRMRS